MRILATDISYIGHGATVTFRKMAHTGISRLSRNPGTDRLYTPFQDIWLPRFRPRNRTSNLPAYPSCPDLGNRLASIIHAD